MNWAMKARYENENGSVLTAPTDPNAGIASNRIELAIALADLASRAMAEKRRAENLLAEYREEDTWDWSKSTTYLWPSHPATSRQAGLVDLPNQIRQLDTVIEDAKEAWAKYQLDDVTVFLGSRSDGTWWHGEKGMDKLFSADNAGKFFPKDKEPGTLALTVDLLLFGVPIFKAMQAERTIARAAVGDAVVADVAEGAERVGASSVLKAIADAWAKRHAWITARLKEHLQQAIKQAKLSREQVADIMKSGRASVHWGTQIDARFKELVQNDVLLQGEVSVSPRFLRDGATGKFRGWPGAPDVVDLRAKRWWDVTSTAEEFAKKPPKYRTLYGDGTPLLYGEP